MLKFRIRSVVVALALIPLVVLCSAMLESAAAARLAAQSPAGGAENSQVESHATPPASLPLTIIDGFAQRIDKSFTKDIVPLLVSSQDRAVQVDTAAAATRRSRARATSRAASHDDVARIVASRAARGTSAQEERHTFDSARLRSCVDEGRVAHRVDGGNDVANIESAAGVRGFAK